MSRGSGLGGFHPGVENTGAAFVDPLLKIVLRILRGTRVNDSGKYVVPESYKHLLREVLVPLHKPSGMTLWRDQQPILGLYHKTLVQSIGAIVSIDKSLIAEVIRHIIHPDIWPFEGKRDGTESSSMANTPKLVLLLHEIDTYIGLLDFQSESNIGYLSDEVVPLVLRLCSCISSDNSRSSERALEFFKNKSFKVLVRTHLGRLMRPLLNALCRIDSGMDVPWNPTVRKMTLIVLKELETYDAGLFERSFQDLFSLKHMKVQKPDFVSSQMSDNMTPYHKTLGEKVPSSGLFSLKKSMGDWRPPLNSISTRKDSPKQDTASPSLSMPPPMSRIPHSIRSKVQPPLTVTGVAPWAIKSTLHTTSEFSSHNVQGNNALAEAAKRKVMNSVNPSPMNQGISSLKRKEHTILTDRKEDIFSETSENDAFSFLKDYMNKLKSPSSDIDNESDDGISSWAKAQMAESPVLLPDLKFHDLVFGEILGTGAFSTVKVRFQQFYCPETNQNLCQSFNSSISFSMRDKL
jgi:hypothetical protein